NHPFWAPGAGEWIGAGRLVFGDDLATPDGGRAMIVGSHRYTAERRVHNLTVADLHTFYVTVGGRHLLVHNTPTPGPGDACDVGGPTPTPTPKPTSRVPDDSHLPPASDLIKNGQQFNGRRLPQRNGPPNGTLYKKDPQTGQVTNYTVYDANGNPIKRVDIIGRPHGGVPTPHVVYYEHNVNPKTGQIFPEEQRTVRQARPDEIP
uniref:polymorphic toxin type 24 domain-containing protein n=1 Tax=Spirillospora albida TaxID=58123 RepID=UPI0004BFCF14